MSGLDGSLITGGCWALSAGCCTLWFWCGAGASSEQTLHVSASDFATEKTPTRPPCALLTVVPCLSVDEGWKGVWMGEWAGWVDGWMAGRPNACPLPLPVRPSPFSGDGGLRFGSGRVSAGLSLSASRRRRAVPPRASADGGCSSALVKKQRGRQSA